MKKDGVKANFIYNLIYNIVNIIVPLVTAPYTARVLGAENIGIYSYTYAIVSSVVMFGALGTATYGQKEIASAGENIVERSEKFLEIWVLKAVTMVIAFLIFVPYAYQTTAWIYYALQIPYIVAGVFDISFFFQGIEKFRYIAVRNTIVRIAGIVLLFSLVKSSNDLWIYLLIISVSQLLGNLSMWPYLRGNICRVKLTTRNVMKHLSNVMIYFIPSITYQIYAVLDKAMLGWLVGSNYENGYYEQANKIVNLVVNVISSYTIVMRSRMSALFAQKRNEEIQEKMAVSYNVIAFLVFPMTFGIAAIAAGMVPWFFGDGYDAVIGLLYIFCPIFIFMGYSRMIGTHILTPSGRQQQSNYAQIIAAVVNITLNSLLIPRFFAKGAAVASVTAELVLVLVYYYMVRKEILLKQVIEMGWKKAIAAGIMFVFVFTIGKNFSISIFYTFVEILIGAIVYVIVLVVLRDAYAILEKYIDNATENECDISFIDLNKYHNYKKNQIELCGTEIFDSQKLLSQIDSMNFEEFAKNRHSVRDFAVDTVDESIIRKAVELAQTAPSACNRQSTRVHYIQNRDICKNVLDLQGGAKGHTVSSVIVLTSELSLYRHTSEFKTPYLDSGIYLMNLLYALTYYGIGTCPLIWNDDGEKAEEIRRFVDIPWSEQIVAIIQVGHYATNECKYAASNRRAVFDVLKIH